MGANTPLGDRLAALRASGLPALAPLWIETLPPEEALPELFGRHEPLCRLQRARLLLLGGRPKAAREILEALKELPRGLAALREELLDEASVKEEEAGPGPEGEGLSSRTLAELHAAQGDRETAAAIYRELAARDPDDEAAAVRLRELAGSVPFGSRELPGVPELPELGEGSELSEASVRLEEWLARVRRWRALDGV